jgi:diguanylate cyclase (GGDEF)-like protein
VDPLTLAVGVGAATTAAGLGSGLRLRRRLRRTEAHLAELQRELQSARHAASHDSLTGLPNRRAFYRLGGGMVTDPNRPALCCVVVDLDSFKWINDTFGHAAGDRVLVTVAGRLATYVGDDLVARLGGDEFAGLVTSPTTAWQLCYPMTGSLADLLAAPMTVAGRRLQVTAAVGVAPVHRDAGLAAALHRADCAMYRAKATRAGIASYDPALDDDQPFRPVRRPPAAPPAVGPDRDTGPRRPARRAARTQPAHRVLIQAADATGTTGHPDQVRL